MNDGVYADRWRNLGAYWIFVFVRILLMMR